MTLQECYKQMGADYADVAARLRKEERIRKFLGMLPDDPSYPALCRAIEAGSSEEAFRAAHTLKGICQNLALTALYQQASTVTELLRGGKPVTEPVRTAFAQLQTTYRQTVECIRALD